MKMRPAWAVLALLAVVTLSACSKEQGEGVATVGGPGQNQTDPSQPASDPQERTRQFVACMRAEGIDVPDPEPGATGKGALRFEGMENIPKDKLGPAMEKCSVFLPEGGAAGQLSPEELERQRQLAQCMRDNGVPNWPDPDPEGGFRPGQGFALDKNDPALRAAFEKCRNMIAPSASPGGK